MSGSIIDEPTPEQEEAIKELAELTAKKLRQWRSWGGFHSMSAEVMTADGPVKFTCQADDSIWFRSTNENFELTV